MAVAAAAPAKADGETALARLFPKQADVFVSAPGLARLRLPNEVLSACRSDLSDLRVFDSAGGEVPFLVDSGAPPDRPRSLTEVVDGRIIGVSRQEKRRDAGPPVHRETYELAVPANSPEGGAWELLVATGHRNFVRRVHVRAGESGEPLVDGLSIFDLGTDSRRRTALSLPPFTADRVTVTLEGEDGFYLDPTFRFRRVHELGIPEPATVPLEEVERQSHLGVTTVVLARPAGIVPDTLRLATSTGSFDRTVRVWDERVGSSDELIGRGEAFRAQTHPPAELLEIPLQPARGEQLRLEIDDGDSPPLTELAVVGVLRRPLLVFSIPGATGASRAGILRFGGGRAWPPRYDLSRLLAKAGQVLPAAPAATARPYDPAALPEARLGEVRDNPAFNPAPALAFAMRPGGPVDARLYTHRRLLRFEASPEGLVRFRLRPEDVAHARADLADLRVVDTQGRQWPYLMDIDGAREWLDVQTTTPTTERGASTYRLRVPVSPLRLDALWLDIDAPFFDRPYRLTAKLKDKDNWAISQGRLVQDVRRPEPVTVRFAPTRVAELGLQVEDGDDAPLRVRGARLRVLLPEVFVTAPVGEYQVLLGRPSARAPRYEIARVRDMVLAVASAPVVTGDLEPNPKYSLTASVTTGSNRRKTLQQVLLWASLAVAVAVLAFLTFRLARKEARHD